MEDLRSKILDAHPSLGQIVFIFVQFSVKFGQIIGWCTFGVGAPHGKFWICRCSSMKEGIDRSSLHIISVFILVHLKRPFAKLILL